MLRLQTECPTTVDRGEESVAAAEIQPRVIEASTAAPTTIKCPSEPAPKVRIVQVRIPFETYRTDKINPCAFQVNPFDVAQDMIIPPESSAVALNLSKETR